MSIFRNTFQDDIKAQLGKRQEAMLTSNRTPEVIQYLNSRNSWIRMTSSVNVGGSATSVGSSDIAKNNVLLGGTLSHTSTTAGDKFTLKSGVGGVDNAYAYKTALGTQNHRLGLRPMPGITNMDIKSKSAYGSLREAVVNFQCWDIRQLEELELLYMRPGYTVLVEWGWVPYLDNGGKLVTTPPDFYDILNKGTTNRSTIFKDLYNKTKLSGGNYDAMFGYVKNYQWSARPDGGYDCQTTIISTGEIIESLKVNYVLPDLTKLNSATTNTGFLDSEFTTLGITKSNVLKEHYERNILAGVWAEAYYRLKDALGLTPFATLSPTSIFKDKYAIIKAPYLKTTSWSPLAGTTQFQYYITLEAVFDVLNKYVIPKDENGGLLMELSTQTEGYTGTAEDLLCIAHPVQVSVDPTICVIKSPIWYETTSVGILTGISAAIATSVPATKAAAITKAATDYRAAVAAFDVTKQQNALKAFTNEIQTIADLAEYQVVNAAMGTQDIPYYLSRKVSATSEGAAAIGGIMGHSFESEFNDLVIKLEFLVGATNVVRIKGYYQTQITVTLTGTPPPPTSIIATTSIDNAKAALIQLKDLKQSFFSGDPNGYDELGVIGNIYVNLNFLYQLSYDSNIESSDSKEKNEINLYKYIKNVIAAIQPAIGNINSFEVHVDPIDNKARVIDVNFTKNNDPTQLPKLFELQVGNLKSVVRNYSLQSQIFPEQSSLIAIGSQAQGGQLGMQNNTMIDFNRSLIDRIIQKKDFGIASNDKLHKGLASTTLASNLGSIIFLFATLQQTETAPGSSTDISTLFNRCKSNLRDLIVYFQSITKSPGANRNIIPFKFSFEMDGIGGLVIGNLFTINPDVLPKGYKGGGAGVILAQTVTGISHTLSNNDWTTKIDALNIVLGKGPNSIDFKDLDLATLINISYKNSLASLLPPTSTSSLPTPLIPFAPSGRKRNLSDVKQIILHDTAGYGGINATIDTLNDGGLGIHYIITRDGVSFNQNPLDRIVSHAGGTANPTSVGIEICNTGFFMPSGGKLWHPHVVHPRTGKPGNSFTIDSAGQAKLKKYVTAPGYDQTTTAGFRDFTWTLNDYRYYEDYTTAQINELKRVIIEILTACPNIVLNYAANDLSIYQNVFGLKSMTAIPRAGQSFTATRDFISLNKGIYAHATISTDRADAHPTPEMLKILREIKTETGR